MTTTFLREYDGSMARDGANGATYQRECSRCGRPLDVGENFIGFTDGTAMHSDCGPRLLRDPLPWWTWWDLAVGMLVLVAFVTGFAYGTVATRRAVAVEAAQVGP